MTEKFGRLGAVLTLLLLMTATLLQAQPSQPASSNTYNPERAKLLGQVLLEVLDQQHYRPQKDLDALSKAAFTDFMNGLDAGRSFFLASDVSRLSELGRTMAQDAHNGNLELLDDATDVLKKRVRDVQTIYTDILSKPFDFDKKEDLVLDSETLPYASSLDVLRERWRKSLKYQTLLRYIALVEKDSVDENVFHADLEKKARTETSESMRKMFDRILKLDRQDILSRYLNSIVGVFDPHTNYFPPVDRDNFNIEMTGRLEGIGAQLMEDDGYIKVTEIVPGSASYRQKELEPEDVILKVAQGDAEPVDVVGMSIDDAVQLIRGPKGTEVRLTVRKPDGRIMVIPIVRDVVVLEDTYARGAVIEDSRSNKHYGYIQLPRFYADFEHNGSPEAADDVKRILEEFKKVGVDGVVLDLRNDGGGSLDEAIKMVGLFIKTGPVVQVQDRRGYKQVLSDDDPSITYDGDLIVMVNGYSASASEIVSAALKDHGRALIVGTPTTFGKGTVQRFVELDRMVNSRYDSLKPLGDLKMTMQQFYRINGVSTQLNGVHSDIVIPDPNSYHDIGARTLKHALPGDTIAGLDYPMWKQYPYPVGELAAASKERIEHNPAFALVNERLARLRNEQKDSTTSLNWHDVMRHQHELESEADSIKNAMVDIDHLKVDPLAEDTTDAIRKDALEPFYKVLGRDIYVDETLAIMNDLEAKDGVTKR